MRFPGALAIPPQVLEIARTLEDAGFETWCVGGAVRDNLLGVDNEDFDLATAARPEDVGRLFRRNVPIGVEHGTVAVLDRENTPHEVTTFRRDIETDGRHAVVQFGATLEDDLARRDFTINAIAYHPLRKKWRDPFRGAEDLSAGVVRAVGDPAQRFREDYLRILRGLRFAARFGFAIDRATSHAAKDSVEGLRLLSAERVRSEWFKGLSTARRPSALARAWLELGAAAIWLPEITLSGGEAEAGVSALDRFSGPDPVLLTSFLSDDPAATLLRLRCARAEVERARRIGRFREGRPASSSDLDVRRWMAELGNTVDDVLSILAATGGAADQWTDVVTRIRESRAPLGFEDLAVTGSDLLALGYPEGPRIGQILRALLNEVLEDPARNNRDFLLRWARDIGEQLSPGPRDPNELGA